MKLQQANTARVRCQLREYDEEMDSISSLLGDLCRCLHQSRVVEFVVAGFGDDQWPVDIKTDLAAVLEQLPEVSVAIRTAAPESVLDFYEQGVQRQVWIRVHGSELELFCTSGLDWQPTPRSVREPVDGVVRMLQEFRDSFVQLVGVAAPEVLNHPWFQDWKAQVDTL